MTNSDEIRCPRSFGKRWLETGPALEQILRGELRRMTEEERLRIVERIFSTRIPPQPRASSGLVEWQRLMSQWRNRQR